MKKLLILAPVFTLAACVEANDPPVVSAFNGASVSIQGTGLLGTEKPTEAQTAEAARVCGKVGKRADYASSRMVGDYRIEHLYLCL